MPPQANPRVPKLYSAECVEEEFSEIGGPEARAVVGWTTVPAPTHQRTQDAARGFPDYGTHREREVAP
jgi:hypothetical protein